MLEHIYINGDGDKVKFTQIDDGKTVEMTDYSTSFIRIGEEGVGALEKKDYPDREITISWLSVPGGPFIGTGFDANDFLMDKALFLEQDHKKIITKLEVKGPKIIITYECKPIKSHLNNQKDAKKDTTKEGK